MLKRSSHNAIRDSSIQSMGSSNDYFLNDKFKPKKNKIQFDHIKVSSDYLLNQRGSPVKQCQSRTRSRTHSKQTIVSLRRLSSSRNLITIKSSKILINAAEKTRSQTLPGGNKINFQGSKQHINVETKQAAKQLYTRFNMVLQAYQLKCDKYQSKCDQLVEQNKRIRNENAKLKKKLKMV